jgi:transcriptional regulator GlxA family with amidase domain
MTKQLVALCDFIKYQLENDKCTADEIKSIYRMVETNLEVDATTKDIAEFMNQSESNVKAVISRNYGDKPKRKVYHSMFWFLKKMPSKWL